MSDWTPGKAVRINECAIVVHLVTRNEAGHWLGLGAFPDPGRQAAFMARWVDTNESRKGNGTYHAVYTDGEDFWQETANNHALHIPKDEIRRAIQSYCEEIDT
jgi:hypothetical protein